MKFKFNKEVSEILDYLVFPRIYFNLEKDMHDEDETIKNVIKDDYLDFSEKMHSKLEPLKDDINQFYQKDMYSYYDFANILTDAYPIYEYDNINDYFNDLEKIDPVEFKDEIIKALITMEDSESKAVELFDESNATKYINQLKIDSANKWNMFVMIQNPKLHLIKFISLLNKIEPLFNSYYQENEKRIVEVGNSLVKRLSINTNEAFKDITYDAISYDFSGRDLCHLYVSFAMPYALKFIDGNDCRIVWGLEMEYSFKKVYELNEDKLAQRVKIFKALGDRTRYETLKLIAKGVSSIKNIADELDVSSATISYHVNEFLTSGILYMNREKNSKFGYIIDYKKLNEVFADLKEDLNFE
ncbi:MAG: helix-turn-helix transcriptional regulator [Candidatus Izemoplasmatales bacterium]